MMRPKVAQCSNMQLIAERRTIRAMRTDPYHLDDPQELHLQECKETLKDRALHQLTSGANPDPTIVQTVAILHPSQQWLYCTTLTAKEWMQIACTPHEAFLWDSLDNKYAVTNMFLFARPAPFTTPLYSQQEFTLQAKNGIWQAVKNKATLIAHLPIAPSELHKQIAHTWTTLCLCQPDNCIRGAIAITSDADIFNRTNGNIWENLQSQLAEIDRDTSLRYKSLD